MTVQLKLDVASVQPARKLFAELRRSDLENIGAELRETPATGTYVARVWDGDGPTEGDTVSATHTTPEGAVEVLGAIVKAMVEKRHADLGRALDDFEASRPGVGPSRTPRRAGRGRK